MGLLREWVEWGGGVDDVGDNHAGFLRADYTVLLGFAMVCSNWEGLCCGQTRFDCSAMMFF